MRQQTRGIDYTSKDYESFRDLMLERLGDLMPEYTDKRRSDAGIVILELNAMGLDILSYYQDIIANEVFLATAEQDSSIMNWCKMLDYTPKPAKPSMYNQVFVLNEKVSSPTTIPKGTVVKTLETTGEDEVLFETTKDLVIPANMQGDEVDTSGKHKYVVPVVQGVTVTDELLGSSEGIANQSFSLSYVPVILESVKVRINEGYGFENWERVNSFIDSNANSKHFMVVINDYNEAKVVFGDGVFGRVPYKYQNGIYTTYQVGGGERGNVGEKKIVELDTNLAFVKETYNVGDPIQVGTERESLSEIKVNAPNSFRNRWGALSLKDFADVTLLYFDEVSQCVAKRDPKNADNLEIYVLMRNLQHMTEGFKEKVEAFYSENGKGRKIVGAGTITLKEPVFRNVDLTARLVVEEGFNKERVEKEVEKYIRDFFKKGNYPFGKSLSYSLLVKEAMMIEGVKSYRFTNVSNSILEVDPEQILVLGTYSCSTSGGV